MALIDPGAQARERRSMLGMFILMAFFLGWMNMFLPEPPDGVNPPGTVPSGESPDGPDGEAAEEGAPPPPPPPPPIERNIKDRDDLVLEDNSLYARFSNAGASLGLARLKAYAPPGRPDLKNKAAIEAYSPFAHGVEIDREVGERGLTAFGSVGVDEYFHPNARNALRVEFQRPRDALIATTNWQIDEERSGSERVVFHTSVAGGIRLEKIIELASDPWPGTECAGPYRLGITVTVTNEAAETQTVEFSVFGLSGTEPEGDPRTEALYRNPQIGYLRKGSTDERVSTDFSVKGMDERVSALTNRSALSVGIPLVEVDEELDVVTWLSVGNHYFAGVLAPDLDTRKAISGLRFEPLLDTEAFEEAVEEAGPGADHAKLRDASTSELAAAYDVELKGLRAGESRSVSFQLYVGPRLKSVIAPMGLDELVRNVPICGVIHVGPFARALTWCLKVVHSWIGNYGFAIIVLTIIIKVVLMPVNRHNQISMAKYTEKMKKFSPRQKEIEAKYRGKTDPKSLQKKRAEMSQVMREAGISVPIPPGCLLMFLQMPIFVGLYSALQNSIELRHAPWLWVQDLGAPDHLWHMPFKLPFFGEYLNILPILMTIVWAMQSKMSMKLQDHSTMDDQQRMTMKMMAYMPIVFGVMFYNGPSGLVLYWTVSTLISVFEYHFFRKAREEAISKARASVNK